MKRVPPSSPEDLLAELSAAVSLRSVCITSAARDACLQLVAVAHELELEVTMDPTGDEDLLALVDADTPTLTARMLQRYPRTPFLLVLADQADASSVKAACVGVLEALPELLGRDLLHAEGPVLLAPADRLLGATALAGEWYSANGLIDYRGEEVLSALWNAAELDRQTLAQIAGQAVLDAREVRDLHHALERSRAETARVRASERREAERLTVMLLEERAWVAEQAKRIASSTSWRIGHRLTRLGRRLAFRADRGTNLPALIAKRMEDADLR